MKYTVGRLKEVISESLLSENSDPLVACLDSCDSPDCVIATLASDIEYSVQALITSDVFDDGAPVIKSFYNNKDLVSNSDLMRFQPGKKYDVVVDDANDKCYYWDAGGQLWYQFSYSDVNNVYGIDVII